MEFFTPFEMPIGASIPDRAVSITDFGAVEGGKVKNTKAFADAIDHLAARGGGRVEVPSGRWLTGPIRLKSGIELHTQPDTEVLFSTEREDYLPAVPTLFEGVRCYSFSAQLYAHRCRDIAVTGGGTFNGQGFVWWYLAVNRAGVEALYRAGEEQAPLESRVYADDRLMLRPGLLHFLDCENVTVDGPTFTMSPFWTVHPAWCRNVIVRNITVRNPWDHAPNTDACNLEGCVRGLVDGVYADTGDDAVCLKSGRDRDGREAGRPCENIVIRHVTADRCHGGVVIGSEMSGGVRNILVEDCEFRNSLIGIWIKTAHERGNVVENIEYHRIRIGSVRDEAVCITKGYYVDGNREGPQPHMPEIRHVLIGELCCDHAGTGVQIDGTAGYPVRDVRLRDFTCRSDRNLEVRAVDGLSMENVNFLA